MVSVSRIPRAHLFLCSRKAASMQSDQNSDDRRLAAITSEGNVNARERGKVAPLLGSTFTNAPGNRVARDVSTLRSTKSAAGHDARRTLGRPSRTAERVSFNDLSKAGLVVSACRIVVRVRSTPNPPTALPPPRTFRFHRINALRRHPRLP